MSDRFPTITRAMRLNTPGMPSFRVSCLRFLLVFTLLTTFSAAWGHVHPAAGEQGTAHACLVCQWAGASAFPVKSVAGAVVLPVSRLTAPCPEPIPHPAAVDLLRGRSPPGPLPPA